MISLSIRRRLPAISGGVVAALSVAGCHQANQPAGVATETASSKSEAKAEIAVDNARLVLPVIPDRPGAVYFALHNNRDTAVSLVSVAVVGAGEVQMHETEGGTMAAVDKLNVAPAGMVEFKPGALHAMVFDLDPSLKSGGTSQMTLTFADGEKVSAPLTIQAMGSNPKPNGDDMAEMPGMSGMNGHTMPSHTMPDMQH